MGINYRTLFSLLPAFFSIGVYIFVFDQIYVWVEKDLPLVNSYNVANAIGAILMGFLSDSFCRRKMFLFIHIAAPVLFTLSYLFSDSYVIISLTGLIYNPLSTLRANLVDNAASYSKIQLIACSFVIQFLPDTMYYLFENIPKQTAYLSAMGLLLAALLLGALLLFDRRDEKIKHENMFSKIAFFAPDTNRKALLTFFAFIPLEIAFFIGDNFLEIYPLNYFYYSILSFASLLGAALSSLYKRIPHVSILTVGYGIAFLFALLPIGAKFLYNYHELNIPYLFMALGALFGFYISFVYDVILHAVQKHFRGTACGLLDFVV